MGDVRVRVGVGGGGAASCVYLLQIGRWCVRFLSTFYKNTMLCFGAFIFGSVQAIVTEEDPRGGHPFRSPFRQGLHAKSVMKKNLRLNL